MPDQEPDSLETLFQKVTLQDDYKAFEKIFKFAYGTLMGFTTSFLKDKEEAENAVSEVFYNLWKNRKSITVRSSVKSYLFTSVRNQALDILRKKKYPQMPLHLLHEYHCMTTDSPEDQMISKELEELILDAIASLPHQRQLIFRMNREEGLKYKEIALKLNISVKTVETQMSRSLRTLRELLPKIHS